MKVRQLSPTNEMQFGRSPWLSNSTATVAQVVKTALQLWRGEWFLDTSKGVPMLEEVLRHGATKEAIEDVLRTAVLGVQGVDSVESVTATVNHINRTVSATVVAVSVYSERFKVVI